MKKQKLTMSLTREVTTVYEIEVDLDPETDDGNHRLMDLGRVLNCIEDDDPPSLTGWERKTIKMANAKRVNTFATPSPVTIRVTPGHGHTVLDGELV